MIFVTNAVHLFVKLAYFIVITFGAEAQMAFVFAQFVRLCMVTQLSKFQQETGGAVG